MKSNTFKEKGTFIEYMESPIPEGPLVSIEWLTNHLNDPDYIIIDCRYDLFDKELGAREYGESHIPGAFFLHMEKALTGKVESHGGRHPIPKPERFMEAMNSVGLSPEKTVIGYDNDGSGASRLWWLLNYYGHKNVRILNGGYPLWVESGFPVTKEVPEPKKGSFVPVVNEQILTGVEDLKKLEPGSKIVDSRARERYLGNVEPIDFKAGHIPGAINIPYTEAIEGKALFKKKEELEKIFGPAGKTPVVYCGSGITSCVSFVALKTIGKNPKLYAGSWSDWISYEENDVATGARP